MEFAVAEELAGDLADNRPPRSVRRGVVVVVGALELGLVEYKGSRDNNLVDAQPGLNTVSVLYDPDAPPQRRYVMAGEDMRWWGKHGGPGWCLAGPSMTRIDVSPDGLRWTPVLDRPGLIMPQNETATIYRFDGHYHVGGQQISPLLRLPMQEHPLGGYLGPRTFVVWRSPRLDRWPLEYTRAFFKPIRRRGRGHRVRLGCPGPLEGSRHASGEHAVPHPGTFAG